MILDLTKFTDYIPTAIGTKTEELQAFQNFAELLLQRDILGDTLYEFLDKSPDETADKSILFLCRSLLANRIYYDAIPFRDVIQTDNGFAIVSNANQAPASKERVAALRTQTKISYNQYIDAVILVISRTESYRSKWIGTDAHAQITDCIFYTAKEFNGDIDGIIREDFLKKKPEIISVQNALVSKTISMDLLTSLLEKKASGIILSVKESFVFRQIQMITRLYFSTEEAAHQNMYNMVDQLSTYLDENLTDFPSYAESKEYARKIAPKVENTQTNPMFFGAMGRK
jgi:hypothetical protein